MSTSLTPLIRSLALMMLIKNLGRHSLPLLNRISSRDSTTRLERCLPTCQGWQGRKIYPITLLDNESSDRTKDTWCIPRCLNAIHEEAGDECVHEKLRADRFHLWCRDTSLPASSEPSRTPTRWGSWLTMRLEFFSWPTPELLPNVVSEDRGIAFSTRNGADGRMG
jgi:hypothetical protein